MNWRTAVIGIALGLLMVGTMVCASETSAKVVLLTASPPCVERRLGSVSAILGSKDHNLRTGMPPSGVKYEKAFNKLTAAAEAKGGDAVVLRWHEAAYVAKGTRRASRPSYISLEGSVLILKSKRDHCPLNHLDPIAFGKNAARRQRDKVRTEAGVSF